MFIEHMAEETLRSAKVDRRNAKGTLTRCGKSLAKLIGAKRPEQEVREGLHNLQLAFDNLVAKHENYSRLIEDDSEFEVQEGWMGECQEDFMSIELSAKMYIDTLSRNETNKGKGPLKKSDVSDASSSKAKDKSDFEPGCDGIPGMQIDDTNPSASVENAINYNTHQTTSSDNNNEEPNCESGSFVAGNEITNSKSTIGACGFKMDKPKMHKFTGDVREYAIFRADQ